MEPHPDYVAYRIAKTRRSVCWSITWMLRRYLLCDVVLDNGYMDLMFGASKKFFAATSIDELRRIRPDVNAINILLDELGAPRPTSLMWDEYQAKQQTTNTEQAST